MVAAAALEKAVIRGPIDLEKLEAEVKEYAGKFKTPYPVWSIITGMGPREESYIERYDHTINYPVKLIIELLEQDEIPFTQDQAQDLIRRAFTNGTVAEFPFETSDKENKRGQLFAYAGKAIKGLIELYDDPEGFTEFFIDSGFFPTFTDEQKCAVFEKLSKINNPSPKSARRMKRMLEAGILTHLKPKPKLDLLWRAFEASDEKTKVYELFVRAGALDRKHKKPSPHYAKILTRVSQMIGQDVVASAKNNRVTITIGRRALINTINRYDKTIRDLGLSVEFDLVSNGALRFRITDVNAPYNRHAWHRQIRASENHVIDGKWTAGENKIKKLLNAIVVPQNDPSALTQFAAIIDASIAALIAENPNCVPPEMKNAIEERIENIVGFKNLEQLERDGEFEDALNEGNIVGLLGNPKYNDPSERHQIAQKTRVTALVL